MEADIKQITSKMLQAKEELTEKVDVTYLMSLKSG